MSPADSAPELIGSTAAKVLLDTGAVLFRPQRPFFFSSGWASPVYVDCRQAMSFPLARDAQDPGVAEDKLLANGAEDLRRQGTVFHQLTVELGDFHVRLGR